MPELLPDAHEYENHSHGQRWMTAWHPADCPPTGKSHGAAGICITAVGEVVLVSSDNHRWDLPAGRPEGDETWEQTLRREVLEEACAVVKQARLLGFSRGRCIGGTETGLVLVRSIWWADVDLLDWNPRYEIAFRRTISTVEARAMFCANSPIWARAFHEAGTGKDWFAAK